MPAEGVDVLDLLPRPEAGRADEEPERAGLGPRLGGPLVPEGKDRKTHTGGYPGQDGSLAAPAPTPLHQHGVEPAPVLVAGRLEHADQREPVRRMEVARARREAVADDRDHLPEALRLAGLDQRLQQRVSDAPALVRGRDVDQVLDGAPVGRTGPERTGVGVPGDASAELGDEIRVALAEDRRETLRHLGFVGRVELERGGAVDHRMGVDRGDPPRSASLAGRTSGLMRRHLQYSRADVRSLAAGPCGAWRRVSGGCASARVRGRFALPSSDRHSGAERNEEPGTLEHKRLEKRHGHVRLSFSTAFVHRVPRLRRGPWVGPPLRGDRNDDGGVGCPCPSEPSPCAPFSVSSMASSAAWRAGAPRPRRGGATSTSASAPRSRSQPTSTRSRPPPTATGARSSRRRPRPHPGLRQQRALGRGAELRRLQGLGRQRGSAAGPARRLQGRRRRLVRAFSGTNGAQLVYIKVVAGCPDRSVAHHIRIAYPGAQKAGYDALVAHVARSLRAGRAGCG